MLNFFDAVWSVIEMIIGIIVGLIDGLLNMIKIANEAITLPIVMAPFLPGIVSGCLFAVLAVCIVKLIVGR